MTRSRACSPWPSEHAAGGAAIATLWALVWLAGCATVYQGKYDWDEGWRVGRVIKFGAAAALGEAAMDDCRTSPADAAPTAYADVAYQSEGRWPRHRVVPVPEGMAIKAGQTVYLNVHSCAGLVSAADG